MNQTRSLTTVGHFPCQCQPFGDSISALLTAHTPLPSTWELQHRENLSSKPSPGDSFKTEKCCRQNILIKIICYTSNFKQLQGSLFLLWRNSSGSAKPNATVSKICLVLKAKPQITELVSLITSFTLWGVLAISRADTTVYYTKTINRLVHCGWSVPHTAAQTLITMCCLYLSWWAT